MTPKSIFIASMFFVFPIFGKATIYYVTQAGGGTLLGSSWANAIAGTNLQNTINGATNGDSIFVACGTYRPTTTCTRTISFSMKNGVALVGSFDTTQTTYAQRTMACGPCTILSGNICNNSIATDNSYKVILNRNLNSTASIDGFVIRDGYDQRATGSGVEIGLGGGMYNGGSGGSQDEANLCSPTIKNCIFQNNVASFGAGVFNNGYLGGNSSPVFENCVFTNNFAFMGGGGIDNFGWRNGNASPVLTNCLFYHNIAQDRAGAMYCWGGQGGNANPVFNHCTIVNNYAGNRAGGVISDNSDNGNSAPYSGNATITNINTIYWGNTAATGPQFFILGTGSFMANYSCVDLTNQLSPHLLTGVNNLSAYPSFGDSTSAIGPDSCWMTDDDGLALTISSNVINKGLILPNIPFDINSNARTIGLGTDMGAYEYALPDTAIWSGLLSNTWHHPQNWTPMRIPDSVQSVVIPEVIMGPFYPIINDTTAVCKSVTNAGFVDITNTGALLIINQD